jgi:hypothetical protein
VRKEFGLSYATSARCSRIDCGISSPVVVCRPRCRGFAFCFETLAIFLTDCSPLDPLGLSTRQDNLCKLIHQLTNTWRRRPWVSKLPTELPECK